MMDIGANIIRLLGAAQLIVIIGSIFAERPLSSLVGSGNLSAAFVKTPDYVARLRIGNLIAVGQSVAIIVLGVLYYAVFYHTYIIVALIALGFFFAAAITFAVGKIGPFGLVALREDFVKAGVPEMGAAFMP
jgi:hypothetical protein